MRSTSNFLPALSNTTPRNHNNINGNASNIISPTSNNNNKSNPESNIKLENRVFYMEKAVARLIHAFESIGGRLNKIETDNHNNNVNIGALSKTIKEIGEGNKDFISKQHIVTERLVSDIHKIQHQINQQTSFMNKEVSDIRDSMQILSTNLQKNFNESIKAAMQQCQDLNVQNSNSITSLRKITDQKISHLQQLIVDSQKRAQSQNTSILDIINSNQKNQAEFQNSFKQFFEKFRDSMHQNLSALQESSQDQISYLDNILRAEVKTRMKNAATLTKELNDRAFQIEEIINQNKRDNKRSWEFINKQLESVKEQQKHQQTANQPLHKIITNLTKQFDEMSQQHLTDIKSIMQLNQDTSEKQFNQIKSLQIQIQHIYSKLGNQERDNQHHGHRHNDGGLILSPTSPLQSGTHAQQSQHQYQVVRPESYRSDMSSTAAFNAIKQHLSSMPGKPTDNVEMDNDFDDYITDVTPNMTMTQDAMDDDNNNAIESASEFQRVSVNASPRPISIPDRPERVPISDNNSNQVSEQVIDERQVLNHDDVDVEDAKKVSDEFSVHDADKHVGDDNEDDYDDEEYEDENEDAEPSQGAVSAVVSEAVKEVVAEQQENDGDVAVKKEETEEEPTNAVEDEYDEDIDNMLDDNNEEENNDDMNDVDNLLGDDPETTETEKKAETEAENETNDNYSDDYEQQTTEKEDTADTANDVNDKRDDISDTEKALEMLEKEQNELNSDIQDENDNDLEKKPKEDEYSDF